MARVSRWCSSRWAPERIDSTKSIRSRARADLILRVWRNPAHEIELFPRRCEEPLRQAIHLAPCGDMDCFAELVIGRASRGPGGSQRRISNTSFHWPLYRSDFCGARACAFRRMAAGDGRASRHPSRRNEVRASGNDTFYRALPISTVVRRLAMFAQHPSLISHPSWRSSAIQLDG